MRNKSKWYSILLMGLVVLLASSMVACGEQVPPSSPTIGFSPSSLSFSAEEGGANPASKTLSISNSGGGTLDWTVTADANWVSLSPTSGASTGESDSVTVSVDISGMDAADYAATVTISASGASNSPRTIAVDLDLAPTTELETYSKYGFSFEYPKHFPVSEIGVLENEANDNSGMVQVGIENEEVQYFQVVWVKTLHFSIEDGLEGAFEGLEEHESFASVEKGELVESTKSGHRMIYQYYTATLARGGSAYGIVANFYHDESQKGFGLMTMNNAISSKQDVLKDFQRYLDSFSATVIPPKHNTYSKYGFSFEYPKGFSVAEMGALEHEANARSGSVQVMRENDEFQLFLVLWMNIIKSSWETVGDLQTRLDFYFEDAEAREDIVSVERGESIETTKSGYQMIYQYYTMTPTEGDKLYGVAGIFYDDDSERSYDLITMGDAITTEQAALEDFENYLDSFVCH